MNNKYEIIKEKYPPNTIIECIVVNQFPFGVFTDIGDSEYKGLIPIIEFSDNTEKVLITDFPQIGTKLKAIVLGITEDDRKQVYLSIKPSKFIN